MIKLRPILIAFATGLLSVGAALAGTGISTIDLNASDGSVPTSKQILRAAASTSLPSSQGLSVGDVEISPEEVAAILAAQVKAPQGPRLDSYLAGASRGSFYPAPALFGGAQWQTTGCTSLGSDGTNHIDRDHVVASMEDMRGWPAASPDCIYLGGFGLGPVRAAESVDPGGVWVRSLAISNGEKTFVYQITDTVGWFARYDSHICADCGVLDVRNAIASATGIGADGVIIGSTHSHSGPDTYGGWGGIPDWYRNQIRDTTIASAKQAIANLKPANLSVGVASLRNRNGERRDTYRSNADTEATWIRAVSLPEVEGGSSSVIATMATFAAHPTMVNRIDGKGMLHADWPGAAARRFEEISGGGVGLMFEGGLGNTAISSVPVQPVIGETGGQRRLREVVATGNAIADDILRGVARDPLPLTSPIMVTATKSVTHPVLTNPGLTTLASAGLFDREFTPFTPGADGPGAYHWSKPTQVSTAEGAKVGASSDSTRSCDTAGPIQIKTVAGGHRIGDFFIGFTPGEIFSNIAEVIKEEANTASVAMVLGQSNDALGYIIQSFEYDKAGNALTEYGTQNGEYEEVFAIDHCFGDHVLDVTLQAVREVGLN